MTENEQVNADQICKEADGCPTETAVLKREWRAMREENERLRTVVSEFLSITADPAGFETKMLELGDAEFSIFIADQESRVNAAIAAGRAVLTPNVQGVATAEGGSPPAQS